MEQTIKCPICGLPYVVFSHFAGDQSACGRCRRKAREELQDAEYKRATSGYWPPPMSHVKVPVYASDPDAPCEHQGPKCGRTDKGVHDDGAMSKRAVERWASRVRKLPGWGWFDNATARMLARLLMGEAKEGA